MDTNNVVVIVRIFVEEESLTLFHEIFNHVVGETRKEEGCLRYELNKSVDEPNVYWLLEIWKSNEALTAHF